MQRGWLAQYSTIKEMGPPHPWMYEHGHRVVCSGDLVVELEAVVEIDSELG